MKRVIAILLISCGLQLTLASDTQYRFRVFVNVGGDDEQAVNTIETYLKRELRLLGDVDIVAVDGDWEYIIQVYCMALERRIDGTKTGEFAIAAYTAMRLGKWVYSAPANYEAYRSILPGQLLAGYYPTRENLPQYCIEVVGLFDKEHLQSVRSFFRSLQK